MILNLNWDGNTIMRRVKLGDVFAFKTDRGYRIIQWAYHIEKYGKYIKVFPGFYNEKPIDLTTILHKKCSYIIVCNNISQLFRKGILEYWGSYDSSILEPFPTLDISFRKYGDRKLFLISNSTRHQENEQYIGDSFDSAIPEKYKNVCMLNSRPHPIIFLYLLSSDFDLNHLDLYWPSDDELELLKQKYSDLY